MVKNGESQVSVAKALNIPESSIRRWKKESVKSGNWMGSSGEQFYFTNIFREADNGTKY